MKKCPGCGKTYPDNTLRCSECTLFLITDQVSDLKIATSEQKQSEAQETAVRRRIVRKDAGTASGGDNDLTSNGNAFQSKLNQATIIGGDGGGDAFRQQRDHSGNGLLPLRGVERFVRRIRPYGHYIIATVLILIALGLVIGYWDVIKPVLTCIGTGAVIGAVLLTWFSGRRGNFNPNIMTAGAVAGAIIACVFKYNILGVATETTSIILAAVPSLVVIFGIWLMIPRR